MADVPQPSGEPAPELPREPLAVWSLALGVLGMVALPIIGSIAAIVTGQRARARLRTSPDRRGSGMATAGLVLGIIGLVQGVLGTALLILIVRVGSTWEYQRDDLWDRADPVCVSDLEAVQSAVEAYRDDHGRYPMTPAELVADYRLPAPPQRFGFGVTAEGAEIFYWSLTPQCPDP